VSLYREANLRHAGIAILGGGLVVGMFLGKAIEGAVCSWEPSVARFSFLTGALLATALDLVYRFCFRDAAKREGFRRFVNPFSGGHVAIVPVWMIGAALSAYALVSGLKAGFCS
jgi:hypothetical protein